jgi:hypothetical protein
MPVAAVPACGRATARRLSTGARCDRRAPDLRHRHELVQMSNQHILYTHKALTQMNLQIHHVIDDITGMTGLAIIDAILARK